MGGIEALPFSILVFITGTLLILSLWAVVDAKFAVDHAAREAVRYGAESATDTRPDVAATMRAVALDTLTDAGRTAPATVEITASNGFERCSRLQVTVETSVPAIRIPFLGGVGPAFAVRSTHSELVDPTRSGVTGEATCLS